MEPKFPCLWYLLSPRTSVQAWFGFITDYRARPCDILYYASHVHRSLWRRSHQAHCNASPVDIFQYHNNKHYLKYADAWPTNCNPNKYEFVIGAPAPSPAQECSSRLYDPQGIQNLTLTEGDIVGREHLYDVLIRAIMHPTRMGHFLLSCESFHL
jgi:hypothetical protein